MREALVFNELVMEMMIVEVDVFRTSQAQDGLAGALGQAATVGAAAAGVCQSRYAALPITSFEAFDVPRLKVE